MNIPNVSFTFKEQAIMMQLNEEQKRTILRRAREGGIVAVKGQLAEYARRGMGSTKRSLGPIDVSHLVPKEKKP